MTATLPKKVQRYRSATDVDANRVMDAAADPIDALLSVVGAASPVTNFVDMGAITGTAVAAGVWTFLQINNTTTMYYMNNVATTATYMMLVVNALTAASASFRLVTTPSQTVVWTSPPIPAGTVGSSGTIAVPLLANTSYALQVSRLSAGNIYCAARMKVTYG